MAALSGVGGGGYASGYYQEMKLSVKCLGGNNIYFKLEGFTGNLYKAMNFIKEYYSTHDVKLSMTYGGYWELLIDDKAVDSFTPGFEMLTLTQMLQYCGKTPADFV